MAAKRTKKRRPHARPTPKPRPLPSRPRPPVSPEDVHLIVGRGTPSRGGGIGGRYWHIYVGTERAGHIFMNRIAESGEERISIQIYLDRNEQRRGIGRIAYRLACDQSGYDTVYADMAKKNIASRRAAEAAGFVTVPGSGGQQLRMVWRRHSSK